jgi:hypothetical protein
MADGERNTDAMFSQIQKVLAPESFTYMKNIWKDPDAVFPFKQVIRILTSVACRLNDDEPEEEYQHVVRHDVENVDDMFRTVFSFCVLPNVIFVMIVTDTQFLEDVIVTARTTSFRFDPLQKQLEQ